MLALKIEHILFSFLCIYVFPPTGRGSHLWEGSFSSARLRFQREPTPLPRDTGGDHSPETGRHRESNPGHPDHRTGVLPPAPPRPHLVYVTNLSTFDLTCDVIVELEVSSNFVIIDKIVRAYVCRLSYEIGAVVLEMGVGGGSKKSPSLASYSNTPVGHGLPYLLHRLVFRAEGCRETSWPPPES